MFDVGRTRTVAVLVPGDREVNEKKLAQPVLPRGRAAVRRRRTSRRAGLREGLRRTAGVRRGRRACSPTTPCGAGANWVTGANRADVHVTGANVDRDFRVDRWEDLVEIREGDRCPIDGGELHDRSVDRGRAHLPAGHEVLRRRSRRRSWTRTASSKPYEMGCYGIGITRIMAAAGRAAPRRRRDRLAEGPRAVRGRR